MANQLKSKVHAGCSVPWITASLFCVAVAMYLISGMGICLNLRGCVCVSVINCRVGISWDPEYLWVWPRGVHYEPSSYVPNWPIVFAVRNQAVVIDLLPLVIILTVLLVIRLRQWRHRRMHDTR